jgi:hypothetical protein
MTGVFRSNAHILYHPMRPDFTKVRMVALCSPLHRPPDGDTVLYAVVSGEPLTLAGT